MPQLRSILCTTTVIAGLLVCAGTETLAAPKAPNISPKVTPSIRPIAPPRIHPRIAPSIRFHGAQRLRNWNHDEDTPSSKPKRKTSSTRKSAKQSRRNKNSLGRKLEPTVAVEKLPVPRPRPEIDTAVAGRLDQLGEFNQAAQVAREIQKLREFGYIDQWGQKEEGPVGGNENGLPSVSGLPEDLPGSAKPLGTEGAPDPETLFNDIPRKGASSGQSPPDDGGPRRGYWAPDRIGGGQGSGRRDVPDPRGIAGDGGWTRERSDSGSHGEHRDTYRDENGTRRLVISYDSAGNRESESQYGRDGNLERRRTYHGKAGTENRYDTAENVRSTVEYDSEGNVESVTYFDSNGRATYTTSINYYQNGTKDITWTDIATGTSTTHRYPRHGSQPGLEPSPQELRDAQAWLCANNSWMCGASPNPTTPDEMVSQPGREGAGSNRSAATRFGQDAVTNTGDSSFDTGRGATPHSGAADGDGIGVGDPFDGECPTCN